MKHTMTIRLFALTVVIGLACLGSITWIKQIVNHEFFWCGIHGVVVEFGFFIAYVLGLILTGFIASLVFRKYTGSRKDLLVISACSGCMTGIFYLYGMLFLGVVSEYQLGYFIIATSAWDILPIAFSHFLWSGPFMFLILLGIIGLGITGALLFSYCDRNLEDTPIGTKYPGKRPVRIRTVIIIVIAAILVSMVLPIGGGMVAVSSGTVPYSFCAPSNPVAMQVTRSDNSTITLHLSLDYSGHARDRSIPLKSQPLQIMVDDKDFSNQSVIRQQGLSSTISPSEGFTDYTDGLSVTISGPELVRNESTGHHIYVISYYNVNNPWVVVDTDV